MEAAGQALCLFGFSFLLALLLTPLARKTALRLKILDYPASRKVHLAPTPLLGGAAVYLAFSLPIFYWLEISRPFLGVFLSSSLIFVIGLLNDLYGLSTKSRLIFQFLATFLMIGCGVQISFLPHTLWGDAGEVLLTLLWVIGLTNAVNFLDGLDGLAAGLTAIAALFFCLISFQAQDIYPALVAAALIGSSLGFLPYNFRSPRAYLEKRLFQRRTRSPQALIFLGDAGATFLGTLLAGLSMLGGLAENHAVALAIPILLLGVPIFDMTLTTVMRSREGKVRSVTDWLNYAGKDHFHHRLVDLGFTPMGSVFFIYVVSIVLGLGAFGLRRGDTLDAFVILLEGCLLFVLIALLMISGQHASERLKKAVDKFNAL